MGAQAKTRWLEALRSGRFKQGRSQLLAPGNRHCCLGVLAEVEGMPQDVWHGHSLIPLRLVSGVGLSDGQQGLLAKMNDGGDTFAEIADYIEANL